MTISQANYLFPYTTWEKEVDGVVYSEAQYQVEWKEGLPFDSRVIERCYLGRIILTGSPTHYTVSKVEVKE